MHTQCGNQRFAGAPELLVGSSMRRSRGLFPDFRPSPPTKVALTTRILTPRNTHNAGQVGEKLPTRTRCSDELLTGPFSHRNLVDNFQSDQSAAQINRLPTKFPIVPICIGIFTFRAERDSSEIS